MQCILCFYSHKKWWKTSFTSHLSMKSDCVPRLSYGRRMLTEDGAPNRFFLMYLFCNESMAIQWQSDCVYKAGVVVPPELRNQVRQRTIIIILRLDFVLFFLITYHQSLLSIHSSCSFIPATLTILRLDFGLFFFNNLSPTPFIHSITAYKHYALCLLWGHFPYVTHYAPIYLCRGLLVRSPPYFGPLFCTRSLNAFLYMDLDKFFIQK